MSARTAEILIAASLLAADAAQLGDEAAAVAKAGADWLHIDVMDGRFVPHLSFGAATVAALRRRSHLSLDVHLMLGYPLMQIAAFADAGADRITVHAEAKEDPGQALAAIRARGKQAGLALKPETSLTAALPYLEQLDLLLIMTVAPGIGGQAFLAEQLPKLAQARQAIDACGRTADRPILLQVDGGITTTTAVRASAAGADVLVAGTAIFKSENYDRAIARLRGELEATA